MNDAIILIFQLMVLLFSIMVHEVSHGVMAYRLGDDTAKLMGRLTLNPLKHLDPVGSILVPIFLLMVNSPFLFGWAKPVPFNPYKLKNPTTGAALIGAAGPLSNFILAIIFGCLIRIIGPLAVTAPALAGINFFFNIIVFINILLGVFNLIPIPPLDGSRLLFALISDRYMRLKIFLEQYGFFILLFLIFFAGGFRIILPIIYAVYSLIVGPYGLF